MTRPDMYVIAGFEGKSLHLEEIQYLPEELLQQTKKQIELITEAASQDYRSIIQTDQLSFSVLDAVDKYHDRKLILEIIKQSDPEGFANPYLVAVCEFGAAIGHLFNAMEGFGWLYSYPYFRSIIMHKETGFGITVFD